MLIEELMRGEVGEFHGNEFMFIHKVSWFKNLYSNQFEKLFQRVSHKLHMRLGASYDYHTKNDYVVQWPQVKLIRRRQGWNMRILVTFNEEQ